MKKYNKLQLISSLILIPFILISCSKKEQVPDSPEVSVIKAMPEDVVLKTRLSGKLEPEKKADILARANGVIEKIYFEEGSNVKENQNLFLIDDKPYRAAYNKALANFKKLEKDLVRMKALLREDAISRNDYDTTVQAYEAAKSDYQTAKINLGYAHVTSPISGQIGAAEVKIGQLVGQAGPAGPTLLAKVQNTENMIVNMYQSANEVMKLKKALAEGKIESVDGNPKVEIVFEDNTKYDQDGVLLFTNTAIDEATGKIQLKAKIPNPDNILPPGLFVYVNIYQSKVNNAFVIPKQAVTREDNNDSVIIVNPDGTYKPQKITIVDEYDNNYWVVNSGIKEGDLVLVEGAAKLFLQPKTLKATIITKEQLNKK